MAKIKVKSKKEVYEQKAEALVLPVIEKSGVELVDVEFATEGGINYLRIFIDKEDGITFEDCKRVNNPFSKLLDEMDFIEEPYMLEVGSPGLGRALKKERDFQRNIGREVEVRTYQKVNKAKDFVGLLEAWNSESITILMENGENIEVQCSNIALIREYVEF